MIELSMSTQNRTGTFTRKIQVTTNDPTTPKTTLVCEGDVKVAVVTKPNVASFSNLTRSSPSQTTTVTLKRGDGGPISPTLIKGSNENISAEIREITPGEEYALDVTVTPPWPNDALRGLVSFKTGVDEAATQSVRVHAAIPARVQAVPKEFRLPRTAEEDVQEAARFQWSGGPAKRVLTATCSDPGLTVTLADAGDRQELNLHMPAGYTPPRSRAQITVTTDDEEVPSFTIPIRFTSPKAQSASSGRLRVDSGRTPRARTGAVGQVAGQQPRAQAAPAADKAPAANTPSGQQTPPDKGKPNMPPPKKEPPSNEAAPDK